MDGGDSRLSAWIEKRGEALTVRWKFAGRFGRRKVPDKKTARILVREIETAHALGEHWEPRDKSNTGDPDITDLIKDRIERGRRTRRPNTLENWKFSYIILVDYLRTIKRRGKLPISMLSEPLILGFYDWLVGPKGNAQNTAHLRTTHVRALWKWAASCAQWIEWTPLYVEVELPQPAAPPRKRAPTWAQLDKMIEVLRVKAETKSNSHQIRPRALGSYRATVIMRFTGLRRSQASRLAWEDFDLDNNELYVRPELGKSKSERRGRTIPISRHLSEEMAAWGKREGLICGELQGQMINLWLRKCFEEASIPGECWENQTAHCLRRSFTSELVSRGAMRFAVEILCGRSTGVGGDIYTDPRFLWEKLKEAVDMVEPIGANNEIEITRKTEGE